MLISSHPGARLGAMLWGAVLCGIAWPGVSPYQAAAERGVQFLPTRPDSAVALFLEAHALGMSRDSLCYFLAEAALRKLAFDTAMAFNLIIGTPEAGDFRESVLTQRHRLYLHSGLLRDAGRLADSLRNPPAVLRERELHMRMTSGYLREDNYPAWSYPFGMDLGGYRPEGFQLRNQAGLSWPLFIAGNSPWRGGIACDVSKSYAKDSLDYRAGLQLKAEDFPGSGYSMGATAEVGNITDVGVISSYKLESSFLSFSDGRLSMIQAGYHSEWTGNWRRRFDGAWISLYHDRSALRGRGFIFSLSVTANRVDPLEDARVLQVMYVDDISRPEPAHYRDAGFQDSIPASRITAFSLFTEPANTGSETLTTRSPQSFLTVLPSLGFAFPVLPRLTCDIGAYYGFAYYPSAYAWDLAPAPRRIREQPADFLGLALNRADGRMYAAMLTKEGGVEEYYGPVPLSRRRVRRMDHQLGTSTGLRRTFRGWGAIALEASLRRNWSTLSQTAPIWIPEMDWGAALKWTRNWKWL